MALARSVAEVRVCTIQSCERVANIVNKKVIEQLKINISTDICRLSSANTCVCLCYCCANSVCPLRDPTRRAARTIRKSETQSLNVLRLRNTGQRQAPTKRASFGALQTRVLQHRMFIQTNVERLCGFAS